MLNKGEKDDSSCKKFSQRQNQAKTRRVQLPAASCAPHCYLARAPCFVKTLSDPVWGEQLSSCTGSKGNHPFSETPGKYFFAMRAAQADSKERRQLKAAQQANTAGRSRALGDHQVNQRAPCTPEQPTLPPQLRQAPLPYASSFGKSSFKGGCVCVSQGATLLRATTATHPGVVADRGTLQRDCGGTLPLTPQRFGQVCSLPTLEQLPLLKRWAEVCWVGTEIQGTLTI